MQITEKEAIEYLKTRYLAVGFILNPPKEVCEKHNAVIDMAIAALEKQIPMKPIKTKGECYAKAKDGTEGYEIVYSCPSCGSNKLMRGYPCKCGQMIDWEE